MIAHLLIITDLGATSLWGLPESAEQLNPPQFQNSLLSDEPSVHITSQDTQNPSSTDVGTVAIETGITETGTTGATTTPIAEPETSNNMILDADNNVEIPTNTFEASTSADQVAIPKIPEFNKLRIIKPIAKRAKTMKPAAWMAEEHYQDDLQLQSYTKDQRAVIPGRLPAAPLYGPSRELQIKVSSNFPTVYAHRMTPSDFEELAEENQMLRNKILERMWACPICNMTFKNFDDTRIREHVQEHISHIQEAGECPLCGSASWTFMSMEERRGHLAWHMANEREAEQQAKWRNVQCRACDGDLSGLSGDAIVTHCLKHSPDLIQYCDKCGLHEGAFSQLEQLHHHQVCHEAPERRQGDPEPNFCESCGKDKSCQTHLQRGLHFRDCLKVPSAASKRFCTKCGLDTTQLNNVQLAGHNFRCRIPRGVKGKYCGRCCADLSELDTVHKLRHRRVCRPKNVSTASIVPAQGTHKNTGMLLYVCDVLLVAPHLAISFLLCVNCLNGSAI